MPTRIPPQSVRPADLGAGSPGSGPTQKRDAVRVGFDISVLGNGHREAVSRAGIFRAVEWLARGLKASPDVALAFTVCGSLRELEWCFDYLGEMPELGGTPVLCPPGARRSAAARHRVRVRFDRLPVGLVGQSSIAALRRVSVKLAELAVVPGRPVTRATLREVDVFHSTFYPLPSDLRSRDLVRFLTVYDLIPLLYPELFAGNPSARHVLARAIASISGGDWVICISESTKRDLCQYAGIRAEQVFVAPLAASPDLFHPVQDHDAAAARRQRYGLPSEPYVLTVNTIEPRKNLALAIRAFARLIEQEGIRDLRLVLVGPKGWDYNGVLGAIQEFPRVRDRVILSGYIPDKDLATVYSGAMMFLYPSLYEGFGLPPLEAMQCGLPVITSNTSSLPEVVGDAGITVAPTDEDAVSESILRLYWDRGLREALAAKSLERSRQFSWDRCTQDTVAAYKWAVDCR